LILSIKNLKNVEFYGLHVHIGSQIFDIEPYLLTVDILMNFVKKLSDLGITVPALNLGGGFAARYVDADAVTTPEYYAKCIETVAKLVALRAAELSVKKPHLVFEPGRSIVAEAGITLYTVGAIKDIEGVRKYVAVDGGMFENPRYALYGAKYSAIIASRATEAATDTVSIAGKCCESGDIIAKDVKLQPARRGDILAVFSTGAYNYSMSSHYNLNLVPPVVLVKDGKADYIVKPETFDDLLRNNVVPNWMV
jgi:Diaminopimelate decarboxylase